MVGVVTGSVAAGLAVASVGVAAYSAYSANQNANKQLGVENTQLGLQEQQMQMEQGLFNQQQPYRDQLNALIKSPGQIVNDPGYQFFKSQGEESVARQFAANPGGAEGAALTNYGQQYASSAYQQQTALLASLSGLTTPASSFAPGSNPVGAGANATNSQNQSFQQLMQVLAQGGAIAKMFGPQGSFSSAGTPGASGGGGGGVPGLA